MEGVVKTIVEPQAERQALFVSQMERYVQHPCEELHDLLPVGSQIVHGAVTVPGDWLFVRNQRYTFWLDRTYKTYFLTARATSHGV